MNRLALHCFAIASALLLACAPAQAQKIRVGYWTSGVSLGFGNGLP